MHALSPLKKSRARSGGLDAGPVIIIDDLAQLRHKVINDYQAVIACIFDEGVRSPSPEVKEALSRVADCVHELAFSLRRSEPNYREPAAPSFDFEPDKM